MFVGSLELDVLLGDVHSLKEKRSVVRPVVTELRRRFEVAVAEAGHLDLHRRALLGVGGVAADAGHVTRCSTRCERLVAARPELELLSARRRMLGPDDESSTRTGAPLDGREEKERSMVDQARARRLAKRISQIVAAALEHEVKDPRL